MARNINYNHTTSRAIMYTFLHAKKTVSTVQDGILPETCGYDFHYVIEEGEASKANQLMLETVGYIKDLIKEKQHTHQHYFGQVNRPVGPWRKPMWEIQLFTVDVNDSSSDPGALEESRQIEVYQVMLQVAEYLKREIATRGLKGSLLVHANNWPINSNLVLERELHFPKSWLVCGEPVDLKDIWNGPSGWIAVEAFVKEQLEAGKRTAQEMLSSFRDKFPYNSFQQLTKILDGQLNLALMNQEINEQKSNLFSPKK